MPLISIIVPVYNIEEHIERCIKSLTAQRLRDIEIILVDDGSTDSSGKICDDYKKTDPRITVIHQKNAGLSEARNSGIDVASGRYLGFVDGDDFVSERMYSELYRIAEENNADISVCGYASVPESRINGFSFDDFHQDGGCVVFDKKEALLTMLEGKLFFVNAWDKLYKRGLFDGVRYPAGKIHEDMFTTYKLFDRARNAAYTPQKLYGYVTRDQSITNSKFNSSRFDNLEALDEMLEYFENAGGGLRQKIYNLCYKKSLYLLNLICREPLTKTSFEHYKMYKRYVKSHKDILLRAQGEDVQRHIRRVTSPGSLYFLRYRYSEQLERFTIKRISGKIKRTAQKKTSDG